MEIENEIQENDIQDDSLPLSVVTVSQEDFYKFNNNFVLFSGFVSIALGILLGAILGHMLYGIFTD